MGKQAPAYPAAPDSESVIKERQVQQGYAGYYRYRR